jgi:hypothetical protein
MGFIPSNSTPNTMGIDLQRGMPQDGHNQEAEMDRLVIRSKEHRQELSGIGARESEMDIKDTIGQRIDSVGTKVEDLAGTGEGDSPGG